MKFNFERDEVRILEPFAVLFIIIGIGNQIILPSVAALTKISDKAWAETTKTIWIIAAVSALTYSVVVLRYRLKKGVLDRLFYFAVAVIFAALAAFKFYLP